MTIQTITSPSGERLVVIPERDYDRLVEAAEDNSDRAAVDEFRRKLAAGDEELLPSDLVDRVLGGESPVRVWREHRGLTVSALAIKAGIGQSSLSQIELGKRQGQTDTLRKIADALGVDVGDLLGPESVEEAWRPSAGDRFHDLLRPGVQLTSRQIAETLGVTVRHVDQTLGWRLEHGFVSTVPGSRPRLWTGVEGAQRAQRAARELKPVDHTHED